METQAALVGTRGHGWSTIISISSRIIEIAHELTKFTSATATTVPRLPAPLLFFLPMTCVPSKNSKKIMLKLGSTQFNSILTTLR